MKLYKTIISAVLMLSMPFAVIYTTNSNMSYTPEAMHERAHNAGPNNKRLKMIDPDNELKEFEQIKAILNEAENEYLRIVMLYIDVAKDKTDKYFRHKDYVFNSTVDYFPMAISMVGDNHYLHKGMIYLHDCRERLDYLTDYLIAANVDQAELNDVQYRLRKNNAIFHLFRGDQANVRYAIAELEAILQMNFDEKIALSEEQKISLYTYLAGACNVMADKTWGGGGAVCAEWKRKELYNLWKLAEIKNGQNEKLRDLKLMNLLKTFYTVLDYRSLEYKDMYKPYLDQLGLGYKTIEEKADDRAEKESKQQPPARPVDAEPKPE